MSITTFMHRSASFVTTALLIGLTGAGLCAARSTAPPASPAAVNQARLDGAERDPDNWMEHGRTYAEQYYSPLDQIDAGSVSKLSLAWYADLDTNRGQEATPLVVDGVMYFSTAWSKVYALDARTGRKLWQFDPHVDGAKAVHACCDVVNRGVAVWKGRVFVATIDGRLIALDAATGAVAWSTLTLDPKLPYTVTGAPRVFKDKVVIGNGGAEYGVRGYVTAYDTRTGAKVWRFYTVPGNPALPKDDEVSDSTLATLARPTWFGEWWKYGGGGTVWDSMVYDPELDQLYIGVGNGSPWNYQVRSAGKGDNLFLSSIVALNPDTGKYLWHFQGTPGESYDFTQTQPMMLTTLNIDGQSRKVILQAPKNGFFYVIDRTNGRFVSAQNYVPQNWAKSLDPTTGRPVFEDNAKFVKEPQSITPSSLGGHNWMPMSFSPQTGLVYLPIMSTSLTYAQDPDFQYRPGRWNTAVRLAPPTGKESKVGSAGALIAWDPVAQQQAWRVDQPDMWNGGTLATGGGLVFQGNEAGRFRAYDARTGRQLWDTDAQSGIIAAPMTYRVDGQQYIAVIAGLGGSAPLFLKAPGAPHVPINGRVLAFRLGGASKLPPFAPTPLPPLVVVKESFDPKAVAHGEALYWPNCMICHGGGILPDLQRSGFIATQGGWQSVVIGGALEAGGMASFRDYLSDADAEAIRAFVATQAAAAARAH